MKTTYFLFLSILFSPIFLSAQSIPNGGFENWSAPNAYNVPDSWGNLNVLTSEFSVYTCTKGSPGSAGAAFLKLTTKNIPGVGVINGIAVSGNLNTTDMSTDAGFPYSERPISLTGKWQYMGFGADMGIVAVYLTKWNSLTTQRDTVGGIFHPLTGMEMSWASFSLPIVYLSNETPDSCLIALASSGESPVANSYLYVDELAFELSSSGFNTVKTSDFILYPNPAQTDLTLELPASSALIQIFDFSGKLIQQQTTNGNSRQTINLIDFAPGVYWVQVQTKQGISTSRFIRQ